MIIFLAAVLDVPQHLDESAQLDGAGSLPAPALGDAAVDQPGDPLRPRARRDPGAPVLHAGVRRGERRGRPGVAGGRDEHPRARLPRGLDALLSRSSSTGTASASSNMGYASALAMLLLGVSFLITLRDHPQLAPVGALRGGGAMSAVRLRRSCGARLPKAVRRRRFLVGVAQPQPADRRGARVPPAGRVRRSDLADDERAGALDESLARAVPLEQLRRRVPQVAAVALDDQLVHLRVARHARAPALEHPRRLRPRTPALAGPRCDVHGRACRADAAAAGDGHPALRDVGEAAPRRDALAADHPELVRRRVRDLPAAAVLHDDPGGVHRRRARRRLRRAPHPHHGRLPAREAGDRRGRALLGALYVERLLPAAALRRRELGQLGRSRSASRSSGTSIRCSGR